MLGALWYIYDFFFLKTEELVADLGDEAEDEDEIDDGHRPTGIESETATADDAISEEYCLVSLTKLLELSEMQPPDHCSKKGCDSSISRKSRFSGTSVIISWVIMIQILHIDIVTVTILMLTS